MNSSAFLKTIRLLFLISFSTLISCSEKIPWRLSSITISRRESEWYNGQDNHLNNFRPDKCDRIEWSSNSKEGWKNNYHY